MALRDPERYLDRRTYRRHLKRGNVTEADYHSYLAELPDVVENIMPKEEGGDDDGYEQRVAQKVDEPDESTAAETAEDQDQDQGQGQGQSQGQGEGERVAAPEGADGPSAG